MINCQCQKRRRVHHEVETGTLPPGYEAKEDPPPEYELPPTYVEAVLKPSVQLQQQSKNEDANIESHL